MPFLKDPVQCNQSEMYKSICDASQGPSPLMKNKCFHDGFVEDFQGDILKGETDLENIDICNLKVLDALKLYRDNKGKYGSTFRPLYYKAAERRKTPSPVRISPIIASPQVTRSPPRSPLRSPLMRSPPKSPPKSPLMRSPVASRFAFRQMSPTEEDWRASVTGASVTGTGEFANYSERNYMRHGSPKQSSPKQSSPKQSSPKHSSPNKQGSSIQKKNIPQKPAYSYKPPPPAIAVRMNKSAKLRFASFGDAQKHIKKTIKAQVFRGGKYRTRKTKTGTHHTRKYKKNKK
jgi:hypothetical protein